MGKKGWIIFAAIVIALLGALVFASRSSTPQVDVSAINGNGVLAASPESGNIADHVFGKADSKVVLIEYGDYQCPGCKSAFPRIKELTEAYQNELAFVFRNFPLSTKHANARAAAGAAEAAGMQGKYWEMHDTLYTNQTAWQDLTGTERTDVFNTYATSIGLDSAQFSGDIGKDTISQKISFDQALGKKALVDSTPSFYLNGVKLDSAVWGDQKKLAEAINAELQKAGITPPAFTPTSE